MVVKRAEQNACGMISKVFGAGVALKSIAVRRGELTSEQQLMNAKDVGWSRTLEIHTKSLIQFRAEKR